jgi:predicted ester cyclase
MKLLLQSNIKVVIFTLTTLLFFTIGCQQPDPALELKPKFDAGVEAWNTGNLDGLDDIIDSQYVRHVSPSTQSTSAEGLDSLKRVITNLRKIYPDFNLTVDDEVYGVDKAAARWRYTGTHSGHGNSLLTGKQISNTGMSIIHFKDGKVTEEWVIVDGLPVMQQLGYIISPPADDTEE